MLEVILSLLINNTEYKCVQWAWRDDGATRYVWCLKWQKIDKLKVNFQ